MYGSVQKPMFTTVTTSSLRIRTRMTVFPAKQLLAFREWPVLLTVPLVLLHDLILYDDLHDCLDFSGVMFTAVRKLARQQKLEKIRTTNIIHSSSASWESMPADYCTSKYSTYCSRIVSKI